MKTDKVQLDKQKKIIKEDWQEEIQAVVDKTGRANYRKHRKGFRKERLR